MTRFALASRIDRLEQATTAEAVPLYIRQWLGQALTTAEVALADAEWARVQALPSPDPSNLTPDLRSWLFGRGGEA